MQQAAATWALSQRPLQGEAGAGAMIGVDFDVTSLVDAALGQVSSLASRLFGSASVSASAYTLQKSSALLREPGGFGSQQRWQVRQQLANAAAG